MIVRVVFNLFLLVFTIHKTIALDAVIEQALRLDNPSIVKAFNQEKEFREETISHLQSTGQRIKEKVLSLDEDQLENLKKNCLERLARDEMYVPALNNFIKNNNSKLPYNVRFHKIKECLEGTKLLFEENFERLIYGEFPTGYTISQDSCTILGWNDRTIWGNSKGTYLKTFYYLLQKELEQNTSWLDISTSPLYHASSLVVNEHQLHGFSFLHENNTLLFPHSGYAFGGHRYDINYPQPQGKKFGPEDCSSWISKMFYTPSELGFSTADALCTYRKTRGLNYFIPPTWDLSPDGKYLPYHFQGVHIEKPEDFEPGTIYFHRKFADTDLTMSNTLGTSGHTALVVGVEGNNIITIGYNRDMPTIEGFGLQAFPFETYLKFIFGLNPIR